MRTARDGAGALLSALLSEGGMLGELSEPALLEGAGLDAPGIAQIAASGPRAAGSEGEYELLLEMILEGSRLHYGCPRVLRRADPDLALLLGDQLYALGLARLAALGDLEAVAELADVISLVAQAHAAPQADLSTAQADLATAQADLAAPQADLATAVWHAGALAVGWGSSEDHERAKDLARAGDSRAVAALRGAAQRRGL